VAVQHQQSLQLPILDTISTITNNNMDDSRAMSDMEKVSSDNNNISDGKQHASVPTETVVLIAKWGKVRITLEQLTLETTIAQVKNLLFEKTGVLPKRQKLIGLAAKNGGSKVGDENLLGDLKVKGKKSDQDDGIVHQFILMGTAEADIFVDPADKDDLPDVVDDFDLDFNAGSSEVSLSRVLTFHSCSLEFLAQR
jgi:hypothetical protein